MHSFRRKVAADQHAAWASAGFTLLLALVLLNTAWLAATAVVIFAAVPFALDALRHSVAAARHAVGGKPFLTQIGSALGNLAAVVGLLLLGRFAPNWIVAVAAGVRLLTVSANIAAGPSQAADDAEESVIADIGLDRPERLAETGARLQAAEQNRSAPIASGLPRSSRSCSPFT